MQKIFSLFEDMGAEELSTNKKISVTFAEYKNTAQVEPDDLFKNFSELRAVTYSLGLKQVERVMKFFERGEVILGSHRQISTDLAEMIALQKYAIDYFCKNKFLQKLIAEQKFKFYVTDKVHAKIYLMRAEDGRCRVILTSANFSANAWQMRQKENFVVMDEPEAYEYYLKVFEELRRNSADEIDLNARPLKDLNPPAEEIQADIKNLVEYIRRADIFPGDVTQLKMTYWKIILYMFASPFFARLRYFYKDIVPANSTGKVFPMYMILRGGAHGGKSLIVETGQKLMFDRKLQAISPKEIAPSNFENYKQTIKGCPMLIDDATNRNLQYLKDIVKDDYILINGKILDHGTFIFTSNDAEQVKPEISKRVVVFTINNLLNVDVANRQDATIKKLRDEMHNALYRAYLSKIFPAVEELTEEIIRGGKDDWFPDIFKISSETLTKIFLEHDLDIPPELKIFTWKDYLGEEIKSKQAIDKIKYIFELNKEIISTDKRKDQLKIDLSKLDQKGQKEIYDLEVELPPSVEKIRVGNIMAMKLSEIKKFARLTLPDEENFLQKILSMFSRN